jgi:uncharacterized protein YqgV (UPF0045/DUF77 family)
MRAAIEISMYPLSDPYRPLIRAFIDRLNAHADIVVKTNALSTQVWGELSRMMQILSEEMARSSQAGAQLVFVMKVLPGLEVPVDVRAG